MMLKLQLNQDLVDFIYRILLTTLEEILIA